MFIITRTRRDGRLEYVRRGGHESSYSLNVADALRFRTEEQAKANKCGNETVRPLEDQLGQIHGE